MSFSEFSPDDLNNIMNISEQVSETQDQNLDGLVELDYKISNNKNNENSSTNKPQIIIRNELTLANHQHPLMSPGKVDSETPSNTLNSDDSENLNFQYPDVIPINNRNHNLSHNRVRKPNESLNPDVISSKSDDNDSEPDLSAYQASVEASLQKVSLKQSTLPVPRRKHKYDDISSQDSISNHSFELNDEDCQEPNLASLSPSSSLMDGFNCAGDCDAFGQDDEDDFVDDLMEEPNSPTHKIPTYTAEDERRNSRNWQKITLLNGKTREIDMKVIEPYKRVLSHGGYLKAGGHNAIVMFCACHLPDRSRTDYHYVMDNLFYYCVKTLEQLITDDYVLVYLHGGSSKRNVPPFPWLKKCYQLLDRRLRKSLKNMYIVHPTFWLKSIVWMTRPFISSKFWRKLVYVRSLDELYGLVTVEKTAIPDKVKMFDAKHM
ncbi:PRUNE2 family protein [Megaselia abdita]